MYGEVYQILIALINMISIKYPMELTTEWPVLLRAWQTFNVSAVPLHIFIQILYF